MSLTSRVLIALAAGLGGGIAISASGDPSLLAFASAVEPVGTLWVNAIRMTVIPLVVSLLVVSVASVTDVGAVGRTGGRALLLFLVLLAASAAFAAVAAPPLLSHLPVGSAAAGEPVSAPAATAAEGAKKLPTFGQWLVELVPANPVRAAADGAMLPLVIFSLLFALACTRLGDESRLPLLRFFRAVGEAMLILVRWVIALAPVGVFALLLPLAARMGASAAGAFGYYVFVYCSLVFVQMMALYPVAALGGRVPLGRFARAAFPAQAAAFSSRSSLASLPALIEGAEKRLGLTPLASGFVLPLAVSTFRFSVPTGWVVGAIFLARLYGVELSAPQIALVAATSVALSFGVPGIPAGGVVMMAPILASLGLPAEGLGLLIALEALPDMFKTTSNVTADMATAAVLARQTDAPAAALTPLPEAPSADTAGASVGDATL